MQLTHVSAGVTVQSSLRDSGLIVTHAPSDESRGQIQAVPPGRTRIGPAAQGLLWACFCYFLRIARMQVVMSIYRTAASKSV